MAFGISKAMVIPLLVLNFCLYLIAAALAGSILNRNLDANIGADGNNVPIGNVVTPVFIPVTLIACMVGLASCLAGLHHIRTWRMESLAAAAATALIAWLLTLLAMGLAAKEIHTRYGRSKRMKTVEAFMIITALTELLYLLSLYAGKVTREGYATTPANPKYGTPAATAV